MMKHRHNGFAFLLLVILVSIPPAAMAQTKDQSQEKGLTAPAPAATEAAAQGDRQEVKAKVADLEGIVEAYRTGAADWVEAASGETYAADDALSTDEDSWALLKFHDSHLLKMLENTEMTIRKLHKTIDTGDQVTEVDLSKGEILNRVRELPTKGSIYTIHTPTATSSVRGTRFAVKVYQKRGKWVTDVLVMDGLVEVTDRVGRTLRITDGEEAAISELGVPQEAQKMDTQTQGALQTGMQSVGQGPVEGTGMEEGPEETVDEGLDEGLDDNLIEGIDDFEEEIEDTLDDLDTDTIEEPEIDSDDDDDSDLF